MARFCFVRHGETDWNVQARIQGQCDLPLNANGMIQARALARGLRQQNFAAVLSSDLIRARDTAAAVAAVAGLEVRLSAGLRERHFGIFQGLTREEGAQRHAAEHARLAARQPGYIPPGGESLADFRERVLACVQALARAHAGEQVLAVTHGGVLDILHRRATGHPLEAPRICTLANAALNWIDVEGEDWTLIRWGDDAHLGAALDDLSV